MSVAENIVQPPNEPKFCECGCGREISQKNRFASGHNSRNRRFTEQHRKNLGAALKVAWSVKRKRMPVGSKRIDACGYVVVKVQPGSGRWVTEHTLVMQRHIGRWLRPGEQVHHINGDRQDNRIENLFLCEDLSHHQSVEWSAKKLLKSLMAQGAVKFDHQTGEYYLP